MMFHAEYVGSFVMLVFTIIRHNLLDWIDIILARRNSGTHTSIVQIRIELIVVRFVAMQTANPLRCRFAKQRPQLLLLQLMRFEMLDRAQSAFHVHNQLLGAIASCQIFGSCPRQSIVQLAYVLVIVFLIEFFC